MPQSNVTADCKLNPFELFVVLQAEIITQNVFDISIINTKMSIRRFGYYNNRKFKYEQVV